MRRLALARVGRMACGPADDRRRRVQLASAVPGAALADGPASAGRDPAVPDVAASQGCMLVIVREGRLHVLDVSKRNLRRVASLDVPRAGGDWNSVLLAGDRARS